MRTTQHQLCCAVLCYDMLCCAVLCCAVLCCAVLCSAVLCQHSECCPARLALADSQSNTGTHVMLIDNCAC